MFRAQAKAWGEPVRQVEIVRLGGTGSYGKVHVRFLDGEAADLQEWVSNSTLLAPWNGLERFLADDAAELRLAKVSRSVRGTEEFEAARLVLDLVRPRKLLKVRRAVADAGMLETGDPGSLAAAVGLDAEALSGGPQVYLRRDGSWLCGWSVTERVARKAAEVFAEAVLAEVDERFERLDQERREASWHRRDDSAIRFDETVLRTARAWCGQEQADRYDELVALREEVVRLGELVERALKALRDRGHGVIASTIERDLGVPAARLSE